MLFRTGKSKAPNIKKGKTIRLALFCNKPRVPFFCHIILVKRPLTKKKRDILNPWMNISGIMYISD